MLRDKDIIKMNIKELKRAHVVNKVLEKQMKQVQAASLLGLTERQIRRIVKRVRNEGEAGIIHKSRGAPSSRAYPANLKESAINLYESKYKGFGPLLASEKLEEINNIRISDETLRLWLLEAGHWEKSRKSVKRHCWRPRKEHFGEMVLLDGSEHYWLEGRGPKMTLMGYIDDATGTCYGRFYDYEGTLPAMDGLKRYIKKYGVPMRLYSDKHTTYRSGKKLTIEEELQGVKAQSQFERAAAELGIEVIHANSPQAKGRIERLFGVFQDRLIKEMRLANICNKEQANDFLEHYLPKYIERFSVKAAKEADLHQAVPDYVNLDQILAIKKERTLRDDNTISYKGKLCLIEEQIPAKKILVEERTDGTIHISYNKQYLNYKQIKNRPKANPKPAKIQLDRKPYIPPVDHPWKKRSFDIMTKKKEVACLTK